MSNRTASDNQPSSPHRLLIVRHAEAAREPPGGGPDRDRPLTDRGEQDARHAGARLAAHGVALDLLLSSPAARAAGTARLLAGKLRHAEERIAFDERLYNAPFDTLLACLTELDDACRYAALVAHNPGLSDLAAALSTAPLRGLPTCGIVALAFPALETWADLRPGRGHLEFQDFGRHGGSTLTS